MTLKVNGVVNNFSNVNNVEGISKILFQNKAQTEEDSDYDDNFDNDASALIKNDKIEKRSYGSVNGSGSDKTDDDGIVLNMEERITYSWKDIDVFGEQKSEGFFKKYFVNKIRDCCSEGGTVATRDHLARKHLLKSVTGVARSGEILAVLGSSGAGKTTLLNALAFRSPPGIRICGSRTINGFPVDSAYLRSKCAYVQQDDLFIGSLSVKEHLIFQALLRMDRKLSYKAKLARVDQVISELSLRKCQNTVIGVPGRIKGLSGGERKRLAFASEALTDPHLLLCDEPTSGLDSFMAHNVLVVLKKLCTKGKTVILTIHQPSSEIFCMFDKILLMAEGRVAFLGHPEDAKDFFNRLGRPCPNNYNPADYYVQILAIEPNKENEGREAVQKICDTFAVSTMAKEVSDEASINMGSMEKVAYLKSNQTKVKYRATWWIQFITILWRSWLTVLKEPMLVKVRLLQTGMVALLIGVIFYGQKLDQDGVMNINGALFLFLTNMTFQNVFAVINVFSAELPIFLRESKARLYRVDTYFLGKTLAELPLFLAVPLLFTAVAYPMIGLQPYFENFTVAVIVVALITNVSTSFGYLISCATSSISMALSVGPPVIIPFLIFGGFFLNAASVPKYFLWLSYLSWFRYGNEALLINQWSDVKEGEIDCSRLNSTCPASGQIILETFNFSEENFYVDMIALVFLIILFRLLSLMCLKIRTRSKE